MWGENCTQTCNCVTANTKTCYAITGVCNCVDGWGGDSCDTDINECHSSAVHPCPGNSTCQNTNGSYYCQCNTGFLKDGNGICQGMVYKKKGKRKVQGVPQSQAIAHHRHQEEEETDKIKQAQ